MVKNPPANAGHTLEDLWRLPGGERGHPSSILAWRIPQGAAVHGVAKGLDTAEQARESNGKAA